MKKPNQQGFSAVELLITLFIASLFLIAGNLVWSYTQRNGAESYQFSIASNITYDYLRRDYSTSNCNTTPINNATPDSNISQLPQAKVTVSISCPSTTLTGLKKITSTVSYSANPTKTVSQAIYAN